jgi:hypothetical protein
MAASGSRCQSWNPCWSRATCSLFAVMFLLIAEIHAEERTVLASIADILSKFEHKCTPAQCERLREIVEADTVTFPERTLAAALLRVHHTPHPKDMGILEALTSDPAQPSDVRTIATMLRRFVHMPTQTDRAVLDVFMSARPDDDR